MSAVSNRLTPASMARSIWRRAPSRSVDPTLAKAPVPPNVMVPKVSVDTLSPERPRVRYSIGITLMLIGAPKSRNTASTHSAALPIVGADHVVESHLRRFREKFGLLDEPFALIRQSHVVLKV